MRHEGLLRGVVHLDRDRSYVLDPLRQRREQPLDGGVEALHRPDLDDEPRPVTGRDDLVAELGGERERLLAQNVRTRIERLEDELRVRDRRRRADDGVQPRAQELTERRRAHRDAEAIRDRRAPAGGRIGEPDELEERVVLTQEGEVGSLRDAAGTENADSQPPGARHVDGSDCSRRRSSPTFPRRAGVSSTNVASAAAKSSMSCGAPSASTRHSRPPSG